jgi:hypothetical protein
MVYPNNRHMLRSPGRHFGPATGLGVFGRGRGDSRNRFMSETYAKTASTPDGYGLDGWVPAIVPGAMGGSAFIDASAQGDLLQGGPMEGEATITFSESTPEMALTVSMSGTAGVDVTLTGDLSGVVGLDGEATITLSAGTAGLGATVPVEGTASFTLTGLADLKGLMSMSGESTPFTELSPQSLAAAILAANVEGAIDVAGALRLILSPLAGKATGGGTGTVRFRDTTDTKDRLVLSVDVDGNRSSVTLDPT